MSLTLDAVEAEATTVLAVASLLREHPPARWRAIWGRVAEDLFGVPTSHGALVSRGRARGRRRRGLADDARPPEERDDEAVLHVLRTAGASVPLAELVRRVGLVADTLSTTLARLEERELVAEDLLGWRLAEVRR